MVLPNNVVDNLWRVIYNINNTDHKLEVTHPNPNNTSYEVVCAGRH